MKREAHQRSAPAPSERAEADHPTVVDPETRFSAEGEPPAVHEETPSPRHASASERGFGATRPNRADPTALPQTVQRHIDGITVVAPAGVHADAIDRCAEIIHLEIGRNQFAQRKMAKVRTTVVIIPAGTSMTDVAQFSSLEDKKTFDGRDWSHVRGSGGVRAPDGSFAIGVAEENLVEVRGVPSTYAKGYSIAMHEIAHALESQGMTPSQHARLEALYANHARQDPWDRNDTFTDRYGASNVQEYFAQSTNAFFGLNAGRAGKLNANHNGEAWLQRHDPEMHAFLVELYQGTHNAKGERDD